jgi:hypothetical protein
MSEKNPQIKKLASSSLNSSQKGQPVYIIIKNAFIGSIAEKDITTGNIILLHIYWNKL